MNVKDYPEHLRLAHSSFQLAAEVENKYKLNNLKEVKMADEKAGKRESRTVIANELVEFVKTKHPELGNNDLTAIFSNAWRIVRGKSEKPSKKAKKE